MLRVWCDMRERTRPTTRTSPKDRCAARSVTGLIPVPAVTRLYEVKLLVLNRHEAWSQEKGDSWHEGRATLLLRVPSAIVPVAGSPDLNLLVNHTHPAAADVRIVAQESFSFDPRLF